GIYSIAPDCKCLELDTMKTALLLSLVCAAAVLGGCCCAKQGGTAGTYNTQTSSVHTSKTPTTTRRTYNTQTHNPETGSVHQTEAVVTDPSIAPGPYDDGGPQIPPP